MKGELTEVKSRFEALDRRCIKDQIFDANNQIKRSGLETSRPMVGVGQTGSQGRLEIQLKGEAARTATFDEVERQVLGAFTPDRGSALTRVTVYSEGRLLGEWIRTAVNTILRVSPP